MKEADINIRQLSINDLDQYNELLRYAFQVTEKMLLDSGWEDGEINQSKFPVLEHAHVLGAFDGETLVSQFAVYPLEMNIHSELCPIGFVTSVSTYPEYSGTGLMSQLMKQSLVMMRERGQSLAILYPYSIPLYRHRGWEIISDVMTWKIRDTQLPKNLQAPGYVRRVADDSSDFVQLHTAFARKTHGCLVRNDLAWEEYWRWDVEDTTVSVYYSEDDTPLGYMVYRINSDVMYVKEMIYLNQEARKGLLKYIAAHESMVDEVVGSNFTGVPIAFMLDDSDIKETIRPYIMGRIIDFRQFLKQYRFHPDGEGCCFTFHVRDPFLEWNNESFTIQIAEGRGQLRPESCENQVTLSVGTLTTLLMGYKRAPELVQLERLKTDADTTLLLDRCIIREKPYISDFI